MRRSIFGKILFWYLIIAGLLYMVLAFLGSYIIEKYLTSTLGEQYYAESMRIASDEFFVEIELAGEYRIFFQRAVLIRRAPVVFSDLELGIGRQFFTGGHGQAKAHALASVFRILPRESFGSSLELIQPFAIHLDIDSVSRNRGSRRKRGRQGKSHDVLHTTFP